MARRTRLVTALLKIGATFDITLVVEETGRTLIAELTTPPTLVFPDWDVVIGKSRPFRLHCDASINGLGASFEQEHCSPHHLH